MASTLDMNLPQATDLVKTIRIKDSEGVAVDLSGRTYSGYAKDSYLNPKISVEFTLTIKNQTTNIGEITLVIPKEQTSSLVLSQPVSLFYDIKEIFDGKELPLFNGKLNVLPRATA